MWSAVKTEYVKKGGNKINENSCYLKTLYKTKNTVLIYLVDTWGWHDAMQAYVWLFMYLLFYYYYFEATTK